MTGGSPSCWSCSVFKCCNPYTIVPFHLNAAHNRSRRLFLGTGRCPDVRPLPSDKKGVVPVAPAPVITQWFCIHTGSRGANSWEG
jgi:hypothetical protein